MSCFRRTALSVAVLMTALFLVGAVGALTGGIGIKCFCLLICDMAIFEAVTLYRAALLAEYPDAKRLTLIAHALTALKFLYLLGAFVCFGEGFIVIHLASFIISELIHRPR